MQLALPQQPLLAQPNLLIETNYTNVASTYDSYSGNFVDLHVS
jgi:hypothetical protein